MSDTNIGSTPPIITSTSSPSTTTTQGDSLTGSEASSKKSFFGRKVSKLRISTGRAYDSVVRTLKNFIIHQTTSIDSAAESVSEKLNQVKKAVGKKKNSILSKNLLITKDDRTNWLSSSEKLIIDDMEDEPFKKFVADNVGYVSLQNLIDKKSLTRALIRNKDLSVHEATAIRAFLSPEGRSAVTGSDDNLKIFLHGKVASGLDKLSTFNGLTYCSINAQEFQALNEGREYSFPDYKVSVKEKMSIPENDVLLIIRSHKGKEVRDLSDKRETGSVLFPEDTKFKIENIKDVAGRKQVTLQDVSETSDSVRTTD